MVMNAISPAQPLRVIVTRPGAQAQAWVAQLSARLSSLALSRTLEVLALPLIEVQGSPDAKAVQAAWQSMRADPMLAAVVFVSPSAVEAFFEALQQGGESPLVWPAACLAAAPGPGTLASLAGHGVPPECLLGPPPKAAQFDSESLWQRMAALDWRGRRVWVMRGEGGREWLAGQLTQAGAEVRFLSVYARQCPVLNTTEAALLAQALAAPSHHLWMFSSSEAIDNLIQLAPRQSWADALALATHPRIAERARSAGFTRVFPCKPTLQELGECIQSMAG
jgi:uroporphyrinogen-III synthase